MRLILTLTVVLLFSSEAIAKSVGTEVNKTSLPLVAFNASPLKKLQPEYDIKTKTAILYKMRENIIRRELSFIPKKKWMKWS